MHTRFNISRFGDEMTKNAESSPPVDTGALFIDGHVIAVGVAAGVAAAFQRHKAAGVPAYVWRDGKVVEVPAERLPDHVTVTVPRTPVVSRAIRPK